MKAWARHQFNWDTTARTWSQQFQSDLQRWSGVRADEVLEQVPSVHAWHLAARRTLGSVVFVPA